MPHVQGRRPGRKTRFEKMTEKKMRAGDGAMSSKAALDRIREAELKAREITEAAAKEAHAMLLEARNERERLIRAGLDKARADAKALLAKGEKEGTGEAAIIKKGFEEKIRALQEKAKPRLDEAAEFIRKKIGPGR